MYKILSLVLSLAVTTAPVLAWGEGGALYQIRTKQVKMRLFNKLIIPILLIGNFMEMYHSLLIRIVSFSLGLLLIVSPASLNALEIDSSLKESDPSQIGQAPRQMTEKQMNDLFGEDPYLGQTSYLQSPDGFSQRDKSK